MQDRNRASRREVLCSGAMVVAGIAGVAAAASSARAEDEKIAQELVQYQNQPKDGQECDKCAQWIDPDACKIVAGKINPKGYCVAFAPKEG